MIKLSAPVTLFLLALITVLGTAYMSIVVLKINPTEEKIIVSVEVPESGGLMSTSQVTLRGIQVGKVASVQQVPGGLNVRLALNEGVEIPVNANMRIANLSAAGEQFIDFSADRIVGPFLTDGARIPRQNVRVSPTVAVSLAGLDALTSALDPAQITKLVQTMQQSLDGRRGDFSKLIDATNRFATMLVDKRVQIRQLYSNLQDLGDRFDGYGPSVASAADDVAGAIPDVLTLVQQFQRYGGVGEKVWNDPFSPLIDKLDEYCSQLCPDFSLIASMLKPYTRNLRPLRADIGQLMNAMLGVFPGNSMRVAVVLPPK